MIRRSLLGLLLLAIVAPAHGGSMSLMGAGTVGGSGGIHQVVHDADGTLAFVSSGTSLSDTSLTIPTTTNRALTVLVVYDGTTIASSLAITWDFGGSNQALSQIAIQSISGETVAIWGIVAPTTGNKTLNAAWTGHSDFKMVAIAWSGVDQTGGATSFPGAVGATATNTGPATGTITSASTDFTVACTSMQLASEVSASDMQVAHDENGSFDFAAQYGGGAASKTLSWTISQSDTWIWAGNSIKAN
jgi:hypothetical protein